MFRISKGVYVLIIGIMFLVVNGCNSNSSASGDNSTVYLESNVSFICPSGWAITEKLTQGISNYVTCEKQPDIGNSGLIIVLWFDAEIDRTELLSIAKSSSEKRWAEDNVQVDFSEPEEFMFQDYSALNINYSFSFESLEYQSSIITLNCNNNSIMITFQEAIEDHDRNSAGFEEVKSSFRCNG